MKRLKEACSSARIGAVAAITACIIGAYYAYGQFSISNQAWELGIWKDCRDRAVSSVCCLLRGLMLIWPQELSATAVCQAYKNITYDSLTTRDVHSTQSRPSDLTIRNIGGIVLRLVSKTMSEWFRSDMSWPIHGFAFIIHSLVLPHAITKPRPTVQEGECDAPSCSTFCRFYHYFRLWSYYTVSISVFLADFWLINLCISSRPINWVVLFAFVIGQALSMSVTADHFCTFPKLELEGYRPKTAGRSWRGPWQSATVSFS
jgi:hypothetical protein